MKQVPNILMIMVDQQRFDSVGPNNPNGVSTPNIDQLANEGAWFTHAFNHIPICSPSRQSFVDGRRPETFGGLWNYSLGLKIPALEPTESIWMRDVKEQRGYNTAYIGKWDVHPQYDPTHYGFDTYSKGEDRYAQFRKEKYPDHKFSDSYTGEIDPVPVEDSKTHWMAREALSTMEKLAASDEPWHLRVSFAEPHIPCRPAGRFATMYDPAQLKEWGSFKDDFTNKPYIQKQQLHSWGLQDHSWEDWAPIVARYFGIISQLDDAIGLILAGLKRLGLDENTMVIYTSDHGDLCGSHRMIDKHYVLYDDVLRVPLAVRWPGVVEPGTVVDRFVYNMLDLPPTLMEAVELRVPDKFIGTSLLPLLQGEEPQGWREEVVATYNGQQFGLYTQRAIRDSEWKYIWNTTDVDELYHLSEDPWELNNRIYDPECKERITEMRRKLYDVLLAEGDGLVRNPWMKRQLNEEVIKL